MNESYKHTLVVGLQLDKNSNPIVGGGTTAITLLRTRGLDLLGGYTCLWAEGGWRSDTGRDFIESVLVITTTQPVNKPGVDDAIRALAQELKSALNQDCLYYERQLVTSAFI